MERHVEALSLLSASCAACDALVPVGAPLRAVALDAVDGAPEEAGLAVGAADETRSWRAQSARS